VLRGGSWLVAHGNARAASRYWSNPNDWYVTIGFRVVAAAPLRPSERWIAGH
jgi:formylglycine-generating enzyme required for sulfatase activity